MRSQDRDSGSVVIALGSFAAMNMEPATGAPDWEEGSVVVGYGGCLVEVDYSAYHHTIQIDSMTYAGLTLEADDLAPHVIDELMRAVELELRKDADE